jgi:hypothetical protein
MPLFDKSDAEMAKLMRREANAHFALSNDATLPTLERYAAVVMGEWALQLHYDYRLAMAKSLSGLAKTR